MTIDHVAIWTTQLEILKGYYEFETLDPDNNRIEVAALFLD